MLSLRKGRRAEKAVELGAEKVEAGIRVSRRVRSLSYVSSSASKQ